MLFEFDGELLLIYDFLISLIDVSKSSWRRIGEFCKPKTNRKRSLFDVAQ